MGDDLSYQNKFGTYVGGILTNPYSYSTGQFIDFAQCAANFYGIHGGSGKCVGERDASDRSIAFYTAPLTTHIVFVGGWFKPSPEGRFRRLCQQITAAGYTTYDGS